MLGLSKRELGIWCGYILVLCVTIPWHEPWNDEAQAWLLARDLGLHELIFNALRYESHPPLWYLILWVPTHLHVGYPALSWISGAIAAAGIYFLLRFAPFPFCLRATLPFTYFLAYQYAVVARSYVLFPLLGFAVAQTYRIRPARPIRMAFLLGLLANVCVHGTLVACAFSLAYAWELRKERRQPATDNRKSGADRNGKLLLACGIFIVSLGIVVIAVRPPKDLISVATPSVMRVLKVGTLSRATSLPADTHPTLASTVPEKHQGGVRYKLSQMPRVASYAIASFKPLALALYILLAVYLARRRQSLLILPLIALLLFLGLVYTREWHMGLLWITLLMVLWASWDGTESDTALSLQNALAWLLVLICVLQLPWTFHAVRYDIRSPYSGSKMAAEYLKTVPSGLRIAGFTPQSAGILPYFSGNIFFNQPADSYWLWSTRNRIDADADRTIATRPDMIVLLRKEDAAPSDPPPWQYAVDHGYIETHRFCGRLYLPNSDPEVSCYLILQPSRQ